MEIKITKDQKNPFFERREIEFMIKQKDSTPSKEEMEKILAKKTKSKVECTVVEHIYQKYGKLESVGIAKIYNKPVEKKVKEKKEKKPEEVPGGNEEKPEESKEEGKPKEVSKEEIPGKEEKPEEIKKEKKDEKTNKESEGKVEKKEIK